MADKKHIDTVTGTETVGHEWDGIEELDTPMPRWWLWLLYATIVWGVIYTVLYPAWPLVHGATKGLLNWTSSGQLDKEMAAAAVKQKPILDALDAASIEQIAANPQLLNSAVQGGAAAFKVNCVQCHGSGAAGSKGYPNLNDDDWLWGGTLPEIYQTINHGVRFPGDPQTHMSQMPNFGKDGILQPAQIQDAVSYVQTLSGSAKPSASSQRGAVLFAANCTACHGPDGKGMKVFGSPNLTDKIWLYGGSRDNITQSITTAHYGIMPAWGQRLDPVTVKMLAAYVHSLGGGQAFTPAAPSAIPQGDAKAEVGAQPTPAVTNEAR